MGIVKNPQIWSNFGTVRTLFSKDPSLPCYHRHQSMLIPTAVNALKSSRSISWLPTGRLQQTLARCLELSGISLHSGKVSKVKLCPEFAGRGRYFDFKSNFIPASINYAEESPLCTTLSKDGFKIRTVEHLLSAMEAMGVDNCRIEIANEDDKDSEVEVLVIGTVSSFLSLFQFLMDLRVNGWMQ